MTVDRERRDKLAELLRHFAAGRITNDQWDDAALPLVKTEDPALLTAWGQMWHTYDDLHEHRLTGKHELPDEWRKLVARLILFLYSDLPYEWPVNRRWRRWEVVLTLLTLGLFNPNPPLPHPMQDPANRAIWPFRRESDLARVSASRPRLLGGAR